jgi:hypothetical protein
MLASQNVKKYSFCNCLLAGIVEMTAKSPSNV